MLNEGVGLDEPETPSVWNVHSWLARALALLFQLGAGPSKTRVLGFKEEKTELTVVFTIKTLINLGNKRSTIQG